MSSVSPVWFQAKVYDRVPPFLGAPPPAVPLPPTRVTAFLFPPPARRYHPNIPLSHPPPPHPPPPPQAKKYDRAIAILAKHQWWDKLIGVVRQLDKGDARCLGMCAQHFRRAQNFPYAKETLLKMDDTKVGSRRWF